MGIDPRMMAILIIAALAYYGGEKVVHGIKKVEHKVVHVIKHEKK